MKTGEGERADKNGLKKVAYRIHDDVQSCICLSTHMRASKKLEGATTKVGNICACRCE